MHTPTLIAHANDGNSDVDTDVDQKVTKIIYPPASGFLLAEIHQPQIIAFCVCHITSQAPLAT